MPNTLIFDFDGTLVVENSSRVLEKVMFESYTGRLRPPIQWTFFGGGRRWVNAMSITVGRLTGRRIDWRLTVFLRIMNRRTSNQFASLCEIAAAELTPNTEVVGRLGRESPIIVASCGLAPVIDAFFSRLGVDAFVLRASGVTVTTSGRILLALLEPRDKSAVLQGIPALHYVTDDREEALIVKEDRQRFRSAVVDVFERSGLYHIVDGNPEKADSFT